MHCDYGTSKRTCASQFSVESTVIEMKFSVGWVEGAVLLRRPIGLRSVLLMSFICICDWFCTGEHFSSLSMSVVGC